MWTVHLFRGTPQKLRAFRVRMVDRKGYFCSTVLYIMYDGQPGGKQ